MSDIDQDETIRKTHNFWTSEKGDIVERMYEAGESTRKIAEFTEMSIRSVQKYIKDHISDTEGEKWKKFKPRERSRNDKYQQVVEEIGRVVENDCTLTQKQMIDQLPDHLKVSTKSVSKALKELGYTKKRLRKVPIERNTPNNIKNRKKFAAKIRQYPDDRLYYLDETGFNLHTTTNYGYAVQGVTPSIFLPGNRRPNISVLACICKTGIVHYALQDCAFNTESFVDFLDRALEMIPTNALIVMDNAAFHKSESVKLCFRGTGHEHEYLPPYSPQLNPIEEFFSLLKGEQKKIRPRPTNQDQLIDSIERSIERLKDRDLTCYYKHMRSWLQVAIANQPFV